MKKSIIFFVVPLIIISFCFSACSELEVKQIGKYFDTYKQISGNLYYDSNSENNLVYEINYDATGKRTCAVYQKNGNNYVYDIKNNEVCILGDIVISSNDVDLSSSTNITTSKMLIIPTTSNISTTTKSATHKKTTLTTSKKKITTTTAKKTTTTRYTTKKIYTTTTTTTKYTTKKRTTTTSKKKVFIFEGKKYYIDDNGKWILVR